MKNTTLRYTSLFAMLAFTLLFLANSSGPASNGNYYTGAPSAGGGTESTCNTCHSSGSFGEPVLNVKFAAAAEMLDSLEEYVPGTTYTVEVAVGHPGMAPANYGFQTQFLTTEATPATAGTLATPASDVQIQNGTGDRVYAEHNTRGVDSLFTFEWTAPEAGTGEVNMYVVGNLVNGANGTQGDNGSTSPTIITLSEKIDTRTSNLATIPGSLFPNPAAGPVSLRVNPPTAGAYDLRVLSVEGRLLSTVRHQLTAGTTTLPVLAEDLRPGVYIVELTSSEARLVTRMMKQ